MPRSRVFIHKSCIGHIAIDLKLQHSVFSGLLLSSLHSLSLWATRASWYHHFSAICENHTDFNRVVHPSVIFVCCRLYTHNKHFTQSLHDIDISCQSHVFTKGNSMKKWLTWNSSINACSCITQVPQRSPCSVLLVFVPVIGAILVSSFFGRLLSRFWRFMISCARLYIKLVYLYSLSF